MGRDQGREWVLLAYRLPREPSTPRITVWRKLRRLGAAQVVDGLVALPATVRTREQLGWVANEVLDAGGDASVWVGRLDSARFERELVARMAREVADDYRAVVAAAGDAAAEVDAVRRRTLARLRRELRRIAERDYFGASDGERARRALDRLARRTVEM
ncbi:MAG: Chromate resistance protein ChrB [Actinomycetota bacterium]